MSSTTTNHQFIGSESTLAEPHFDEEATVLSARPVVPLEEVEALGSRSSLPRPWILGLGLVGAILVGVIATVIYYSSSTGNDSSVFKGLDVAAGVEGNSLESFNTFSGPVSSQPESKINKPAAEAPKQVSVTERSERAPAGSDKKPRPRLVSVITNKRDNDDVEEVDEDRRAARKQARQERRRAERERRNGKSSDELLRIRDIFEGSPRP